MLHTIIFLFLSVIFALMLWVDRPSRESGMSMAGMRTLLLALLPFIAFLVAAVNNNGTRLNVKIDELRVPPATVLDSRAPDTFASYLIVGDRPDSADLVVPPFTDQNLARVSMSAQPRLLLKLEARALERENSAPISLEARIVASSFAALPEADIPGMGVTIDGQQIGEGQTVTRPLVPGRPLRIGIWRIETSGKWGVERRSFTLELPQLPGAPVKLKLNIPMRANAGSCKLPTLRLSPMGEDDDTGVVFRDPENLVFSGLGQGGAHPVAEPKWLGPIADPSVLCAQSQTRLLWPVGVEPEAARLVIVGQKTFLPWYACFFALFALGATYFLCERGWRQPTAERIIAPLLQWFLVLRLLVAVAGLYNNSNLIMWQILWDPLAALVCLPALAVIVLRRGSPELRPLMAGFAALVLAAFAGLFVASGAREWFGLPALLCLVTFAAALARLWRNGDPSPLEALIDLISRLCGALEGARPSADPSPEDQAPGLWRRLAGLPPAFLAGTALVAFIVIVRIVLAILISHNGSGGSERLFGVPLSLPYVPAAILGFALMLQGADQTRSRGWSALGLIAAFALAYVIVPFITHDAGMVLVFGIPIGFGIAYVALARFDPVPAGWKKLLWLAPLAAPPAMILLATLSILVIGDAPAPGTDIGAHMTAVTQWDRNDIRLLGFVAPGWVDDLGTKLAFEWLDLAAGLGPITDSIWGQGFLAPSNVQPSLLTNQYSDNLTAIHIVWPLGRLGALGIPVVLLAGLAALAPSPGGERANPPPLAWPTTVWLLAGATLLWSAIYMLLANLNWLPFTGRNVYLLAVSSGGDLAEGLVLVLMTAVALTARRQDRVGA